MRSNFVPTEREYSVRMAGDADDGNSFGDVPDDDHVVMTSTDQDVVGRWMPVNDANLSLVTRQCHQAL